MATSTTSRGGQKTTTGVGRIAHRARQKPQTRYTSLMHHFTVDNLRACFDSLDGKKAVGVDGVTKAMYGQDLEANLQDLHRRLHQRSYRPQPVRRVEIPKEDDSTRRMPAASGGCFPYGLGNSACASMLKRPTCSHSPAQLHQVRTNLVLNAAECMAEEVTIRITTSRRALVSADLGQLVPGYHLRWGNASCSRCKTRVAAWTRQRCRVSSIRFLPRKRQAAAWDWPWRWALAMAMAGQRFEPRKLNEFSKLIR